MLDKLNLKKENLLKNLNFILIVFLIIQPIFDLKVFYNSISTLIRVIIIGILFLFYFIFDKSKKKYLLLIYPIVLTIYIVFHHINALNFTSLVPGNFNYSLKKELLYFVKMIAPFLLLYSLFKSNLEASKVLKIMRYIVLTMGLIIIISNLFVFSYSSYNDELIKANFFSWFNTSNNYTYQELSSKGLFEYANQISAVLLMFLPFSLATILEKKSFFNIFTLIINMFSLFLLGTKVAVFGVLIVFAYTIIACIYTKKLLKKQKFSVYALSVPLIIIIIYSLFLPINPSFKRMDETKAILASSDTVITNNYEQTSNFSTQTENITEENNYYDNNYIEKNYKEKEIKEEFIINRYPYKYDSEFWLNIFDEPRYNRVNYRFIEQKMVERVMEINDNKLDILFGITNERVQNIFNIERDFLVQYYALGILGVVLIFLPYFGLFVYFVRISIKNKLKNISAIKLLSFITICMMFCISYYSGNLLNSLSFTVYFTLLFYILLKDKTQKDNNL